MSIVQKQPRRLYRVRFVDQSDRKVVEVLVEKMSSSDIMGLVQLEGFVFRDQTKLVILPEEDEARQRYSKTERLHIPYHSISFVEEFIDAPTDIHKLPFIRPVADTNSTSKNDAPSISRDLKEFADRVKVKE